MSEMALNVSGGGCGGSASGFVSPYNTAETKYTGPYSIVSYEGPRIPNPDPSKTNPLMHTNAEEPVGHVLFANGARYAGGFRFDMMHGYGELTDTEGTVYKGGWVDDKREGAAEFICKFCRYIGEYRDNKRNGQGREEDYSGNVFVGRFVDGDAVHGKMSYANGDVYVGGWRGDNRHGRGKFISCEEGFVLDGEWVDDEFIGTVQAQ